MRENDATHFLQHFQFYPFQFKNHFIQKLSLISAKLYGMLQLNKPLSNVNFHIIFRRKLSTFFQRFSLSYKTLFNLFFYLIFWCFFSFFFFFNLNSTSFFLLFFSTFFLCCNIIQTLLHFS